MKQLIKERSDFLLPFLARAFEFRPSFLRIEKDETRRPPIGERHQVKAVQNARPAFGRQTIDRNNAEETILNLRRQSVLKLGCRDLVKIHGNIRKPDRVAFPGDAEADELEQFVIPGNPLPSPLDRFAGLHTPD